MEVILDKRFKEKDIENIRQAFKDFDEKNNLGLAIKIALKTSDVKIKYYPKEDKFFASMSDVANYEIDSISLQASKDNYFFQKNKLATRILVSIKEDSIYTIHNKNTDLKHIQHAVKIICDYAKQNNIDKNLKFNYIANSDGINDFVPIFTSSNNIEREVKKTKRNEKLALKIPNEIYEKNLFNALELYKELNLKTFLLKENFIVKITEEAYQYFLNNKEKENLAELEIFKEMSKMTTSLDSKSIANTDDTLLKFLLDREDKLSGRNSLISSSVLVEILSFTEKYVKASQTYQDLKKIFNNINLLDDYLANNEISEFLANKINNYLNNTQYQIITTQNNFISTDEELTPTFSKISEIYALSNIDEKNKKHNYIINKKDTVGDIKAIRIANQDTDEPKSFYDLTNVEKNTAIEIYKRLKNSIIVSDTLLDDSIPIIQKDNKFFHFQYNDFYLSTENILKQKNNYKDFTDINNILVDLGAVKRNTAFDIINKTSDTSFSHYCYQLLEEDNIEKFVTSKKAMNEIYSIISNENRNIIPTSLKIGAFSKYTEKALTSKEIQDNIYIDESKRVFSVLNPLERQRSSITFAGNGFTRNSAFPIFLSISEQEEKKIINQVFEKAIIKYIDTVYPTNNIGVQELKEKMLKQTKEIVSDSKNKQLSICIRQILLDNLVIPVEYLQAIDEFGQYSEELPLPANFFYEELEKQKIIDKNQMLDIPKIKDKEKMFCIERTYANMNDLLMSYDKGNQIIDELSNTRKLKYEDRVNKIKEISNDYCERVYNYLDFDTVLKTLNNESLDIANNFITAKDLKVYDKNFIADAEIFNELNDRLKTILKDKYFVYEEKLAEFIRDNQLKHRIRDIIAKSLINFDEIKIKLLAIKGTLKYIDFTTKAIKENALVNINEDFNFQKIIQYIKNVNHKSGDITDLNTILKELDIIKEQIINDCFVKNFKNKLMNINGLKKHQIDTMFSSLLKPDETINLNFSARAGKTLTSLATILVAQKEKAEFYVFQKNAKDILWQFYNFLPDYAHKMQYQVSNINDKKYSFLPEENKIAHRENYDFFVNIPKELGGLLNQEKSLNDKGALQIIEKDFYNKISMIKTFLDNEKRDFAKNLKETGAIELFEKLNKLNKDYLSDKKDNSKMCLLMSMYLHSLVKEKYLLKENLGEAVERIANEYEKHLKNIGDKQERYLLIASNTAISKIITENSSKISENDRGFCTYKSYDNKGLEVFFKNNGFLASFEKADTVMVSNKNLIHYLKHSKDVLNKFDFVKNSDIKKAGIKQEIVVIPKLNKKLNNYENFVVAIEDIEKRLNKNILNKITKHIKVNFDKLGDNSSINQTQLGNFIQALNYNYQNTMFFNILENTTNISNEKELSNYTIAISDITVNEETVLAYKIKLENEKIENFIKNKINNNNVINNLINLDLINLDELNNSIKEEIKADKINKAGFRQILGEIFLPQIKDDKFILTNKDRLSNYTKHSSNLELKIKYREKTDELSINSFSIAPAFVNKSGTEAFFNFVKVKADYFQPNAEIDKIDIKDAEYELVYSKNKASILLTDSNDVPLTKKGDIDINDKGILYYQDKNKIKKIIALDEFHKNTGENANYGKTIRKNILNDENIQPLLITATPIRQEFKDLSMKQINDINLKLLLMLKDFNISETLVSIITNDSIKIEDYFAKFITNLKIDKKILIKNINEVLENSDREEYKIEDLSKAEINVLNEEVFSFWNLGYRLKSYLNNSGIVDYKNVDILNYEILENIAESEKIKTHIPTTQVVYANLNLDNRGSYSIINSLPFQYDIKSMDSYIDNVKDKHFIISLLAIQKYYSLFKVNNSLSTLKETINSFREAFNESNKSEKDAIIIRDNINEMNKNISDYVNLKYNDFTIKDFWATDKKTVEDDGASLIRKLYLNYDEVKHYLTDDFTNKKDKDLSDRYKIASFLIDNYLELLLSNSANQNANLHHYDHIKYEKTFFNGDVKVVKVDNLEREEEDFYFVKIRNIVMPVYKNFDSDKRVIKDLEDKLGFSKGIGLVYTDSSHIKNKIHTNVTLEFERKYIEHFFPKLAEIINFDKITNYPKYEIKPKSYKIYEALNILYEANIKNEISENIKKEKYFPIFTNRTPTQFLTTLFALDESLKQTNDNVKRILAIETDEISAICSAIDKEKLNLANVELILCKTPEEAHKTLFNLNKLNSDPQVMILPTKKVAEGFQIQKITHDQETYSIFANAQECALDLATTCQALARADCINAREEQKKITHSNTFLIQAKFFGIKTELKKVVLNNIDKDKVISLLKDGKISLEKQFSIIDYLGKGELHYKVPENAMVKIKAFTDFYQDNFRDSLTTNIEFASKTLQQTINICKRYEEEKEKKNAIVVNATISNKETNSVGVKI